MKVVLDDIYTFGMKVVLDELVCYPAETASLDGYGCRQDVERNGMGIDDSKCFSNCCVASRIVLEKHVLGGEIEVRGV